MFLLMLSCYTSCCCQLQVARESRGEMTIRGVTCNGSLGPREVKIEKSILRFSTMTNFDDSTEILEGSGVSH